MVTILRLFLLPRILYCRRLTGHAANGLVEAPHEINIENEDLLLCVHVVVKTINLEISSCHLTDYVIELH